MTDQIYREELGSEITLGPFDKDYYYDIEQLKDQALKSVECVVVRKDKLLFIEAKRTAPKDISGKTAIEQLSGMIKARDQDAYEQIMRTLSVRPAYVVDVCEKFLMSLCLTMSMAEGRIPSNNMSPTMIEAIRDPSIIPVFVLVITWSKEDWARNVQEAFTMALQKFEKTNRAKILVLTAERAKEKGLVSRYTPMPAQENT